MLKLNQVRLAGNLTRDVELRNTQSGKAIAKFGLALNDSWKGSDGQKREKTTFVDCTAWGRTAEVIAQYHKKGSHIYVEGRLEFSQWEDKQSGAKRSKLDVTVENFQFTGGARDDSAKPAAKSDDKDYGDIPF